MRTKTLAAAALAAAALSATACGASAPAVSAASAAVSSPVAPPLSPPPTAVTLAPLKLADFPSSAVGNDARGVCEAWLTLRQQYENRMVTDSPYQLNQWFSSSAWHKSWTDANALGNDPAYSHLEVAYGIATVGDMVDSGTVKQMDGACAKGD